MRRRLHLGVLVGAALLIAALAAAAAIAPSDVTSRAGEYSGLRTGDVLVGNDVVISIRSAAGGLTPERRGQIAAARLQGLPEDALVPTNVLVHPIGAGQAVYVGQTVIASVSQAEARAHSTTPQALAEVWRDNLSRAFAGERPSPGMVPVSAPGPNAPPEETWRSDKQKWVPILSVEQQGVRIGAAQVTGPARRVDEVKAVAEFRLDFRDLARVYVYVPVSTLTVTKLDRVQGVSVWAIGDVGIVSF